MVHRATSRRQVVVCASLVCFSLPAAMAQTPSTSAIGGRTVEDVVVTARKRSERLINVPISITALSAATLKDRSIRDLQAAAALVPDLYIDAAPAGPRISIRGLGNPQTGGVVDSSVGLAIDGLFYGRPDWLTQGLFDLQSLEVLRGPQSTYYGRNTTAGLINIQTRGPGDHWEGYVQANGEAAIGGWSAEGAAGGPVSDTIGVRLAYRHAYSDGYIARSDGAGKVPITRDDMMRLTVDWTPTSAIKVVYKFSLFNTYEHGNAQEIGACGAGYLALLAAAGTTDDCRLNGVTAPVGPIPGGINPKTVFTSNEGYSTSLTVSDDLGPLTLTSETGLYDLDTQWSADGSWDEAVQTFTTNRPEQFTQFSQEFRVQSRDDQPITYSAGFYLDDSYRKMNQNIDLSPFFGGYFSIARPLRIQEYSYSGWADATWHITPAVSLSLGGRYTYEIQHGTVAQVFGPLGNPTALSYDDHQTLPSKAFKPAVTAQWRYSTNGQIYFSFKEGFKAGGFNLDSGTGGGSFAYGDESAKSYELGVKNSLFQHRLLVTAALYDTDISNLQVQSYNGSSPTATILNAAAARVRGVEVETAAVIIPGLDLNLNVGYSDAIYTSFPNAPCYLGQSIAQGCSAAGQQSLTNARLPIAPRWDGSVGASWQQPTFARHVLKLGTDLTYRSKVYLNLEEDPLEVSNDLPLLDAYVQLVPAGERGWTAGIVTRNALGRRYVTGAVNLEEPNSYVYNIGLPRTVEFQLGYRF